MYFGDIDIYLKRNDEPTLLSYDYSNHGIENKYFLHIVSSYKLLFVLIFTYFSAYFLCRRQQLPIHLLSMIKSMY